jgi:UMF1 family MFS transporter
MQTPKNDKKVLRAWTFYDWANSVYNLIITTAIFPIFFEAITSGNKKNINGIDVDIVSFWGKEFINTELYAYSLSVSFLVVVLLTPILSGIADYTGLKKRFMQLFCYLGGLSCIALFWFDVNHLEWGVLAFVMASIGFWGSLVYYNSFLPEIATKDIQDKVSAKGFALGYVGSVLLLVSVLVLNKLADMPIRYAFLLTGIWWIGFAQYTYFYLPHQPKRRLKEIGLKVISAGNREILKVFKSVAKNKILSWYLSGYFVFNMGVQTVMLLAVIFAAKEIDWPLDASGVADKSGLIISVIIIQLVAIVGAMAMARISKLIGNLPTLIFAAGIWILCSVSAFFIHTPAEFYVLAMVVGFVMGGTQSLSRSTYSKLLPKSTKYASYFSFYDILEKVGLIFGPLVFGLIEGWTGSMRISVLMITIFFMFGIVLLKITHSMGKKYNLLPNE